MMIQCSGNRRIKQTRYLMTKHGGAVTSQRPEKQKQLCKSLHVKAATGLGGTAGPGYGGGAIASQLVPHVLADASAV